MPPPLLPPLTEAQPLTRKAAATIVMQALGNDTRTGFAGIWFIVFSLSGQGDGQYDYVRGLFIGLSTNQALCSASLTIIRTMVTSNSKVLDNVK